MTSRSSLIVVAFAFAGLIGANPAGCGLYSPPNPTPLPPIAIDGGPATIDGGSSTFDGGGGEFDGGCMAACGSLDETDCRARPDCEAIYTQDGCIQKFDHCQATQCPALMCPLPADGSTCTPVLDANGCPTCQCQSAGCTTDADCAPDQYCAVPICDPGPDGSTCPTTGTCEPKQICPAIACAPADPTDPNTTCTTTIGPDGCPTCTCTTSCNTDADCSAGEKCITGPNVCNCPSNDPTCDCAPEPGTCQPETCGQDSDCKSGEICQINDCPADMPTCDSLPPGSELPCCVGPLSQCVPQQTTCTSDADCSDGQVCRAEPAMCDCASTDPNCVCATIQVCASISCTQDADCASGEACVSGLCQQQPQPTFACGSSQCTADQVCVTYGGARIDPLCVDFPQACSTVSACGCIATQLCGSGATGATADCSGSIPTVSCGYP